MQEHTNDDKGAGSDRRRVLGRCCHMATIGKLYRSSGRQIYGDRDVLTLYIRLTFVLLACRIYHRAAKGTCSFRMCTLLKSLRGYDRRQMSMPALKVHGQDTISSIKKDCIMHPSCWRCSSACACENTCCCYPPHTSACFRISDTLTTSYHSV
jgi:hypothetical protein